MQQIIEVIKQSFGSIPFEQLLREFMLYSTKEPWFFTEFSFLFTFGIFLFFYALLFTQNALRKIYLIAFSLFFYYKSSGLYFLLLIGLALVDYTLARIMGNAENKRTRLFLLITSLSVNLGMLGYFKYTNFLFSSFYELINKPFDPFNIFLPVGISFFTFQSLSYTFDVYRGNIKPLKSLSEFAFFVTFFPVIPS